MLETKQPSSTKKPLIVGCTVFLLVLVITQTITYQRFQLLKKTEQQAVDKRVLELKEDLQNILGQSFAATQTLSFIVENYGVPENFDSIAQLLLSSNKNIEALELVNSKGVITHVYPLKGNDVLGLNILKDSIGKDGALTTLKRNEYFTAGPIRLNQGGAGFVGRRPLYNENEFAGFAAAVVSLSKVIGAVQRDSIDNTGFSYQLSKVNPDQSEELFYTSNEILVENAIKVPMTTSQGEWKLYVIYDHPLTYSAVILFSFLGLLLSIVCGLLVWFLARQPFLLNQLVEQKTMLLNESQEKYRTLIEQASDGILLTNLSGKIIDVNVMGADMFGYKKHELINKNLTDILLPEDLAKTPIKYAELNQGKSILIERRMVKKDSTLFYGEVNAKKLANDTILGIIRDTTERKKTQSEILELQSKMNAAIRIGKIGYWDWDLKTDIIDWSDRMYEIYDVEPGTIITAALTEQLIHPDDWNHHNEILALKRDKKDTDAFTYRTVHRDNSIKYVLVEMEVLEDENNKPIRYRGTVIDITEQKEAENKILDLQSKMNAAIKIGKFGYWNWEMDKEIVEWSEEMYNIHHINPNVTMTPDLVKEIIYADDLYLMENIIDPIKGKNQTSPGIYRILLEDKTFKHFLAFSEVIYDKDGKPIRYHGATMDVTESVLAEEALRESQEKFAKAFQTNLMGIIILDEERRVIEANKTVQTLLDVTRDELLGKTILDSGAVTLDDFDDNQRKKLWSTFLKEGELINKEFKVTLKNGQKKSLLVSVETLLFNNKENYLVNLIDDTKRKETEETLEFQNFQLKKTNSELDSFVYSASHELRAPLSSVLGLINLSLMEENEPSLVENLTMMEKSIKRLDDFIKDIIEYSRNKHIKINEEPIKFTNLIENSLESFWYLENMSKLEININIDDKIEFVSDLKRISILLNNFISNAIKYHDLTKDSPSIWINIKTTEEEAILEIKDNGLGMAEEQLDKIFDMFYRISSQIMGSGIGLFIVKEVLTKLNGTIEVESVLGEGSMFTIKLPNESKRKSKQKKPNYIVN